MEYTVSDYHNPERTVIDIKDYPHPGGGEAKCVVIQNDFKDTLMPSITPWNLDTKPESIKKFVEQTEANVIVEKYTIGENCLSYEDGYLMIFKSIKHF